jgi:hypothetical protein
MSLLRDFDIDVYCLSHEWEASKSEELAYMEEKGGSVFWTTDYPIVRTSEIKKRLLEEAKDPVVVDLAKGFEMGHF